MSKEALVEAVVAKCDLKKGEAKNIVDVIIDTLSEAIVSNDEVKFSGFGAFKKVQRAARDGRNPKTGEAIKIPAKMAVKFKPSSLLKNAVNQ